MTYNVEKLIDETRRLAVLFRANTGKTLPIGSEIAKFDAEKFLPLTPLNVPKRGVDFMGIDSWQGKNIQLKSRIIFDEGKTHYRLGKMDLSDSWDLLVLILYANDYNPFDILVATKDEIQSLFPDEKEKEVTMSLAKFKTVAQSIWGFSSLTQT